MEDAGERSCHSTLGCIYSLGDKAPAVPTWLARLLLPASFLVFLRPLSFQVRRAFRYGTWFPLFFRCFISYLFLPPLFPCTLLPIFFHLLSYTHTLLQITKIQNTNFLCNWYLIKQLIVQFIQNIFLPHSIFFYFVYLNLLKSGLLEISYNIGISCFQFEANWYTKIRSKIDGPWLHLLTFIWTEKRVLEDHKGGFVESCSTIDNRTDSVTSLPTFCRSQETFEWCWIRKKLQLKKQQDVELWVMVIEKLQKVAEW